MQHDLIQDARAALGSDANADPGARATPMPTLAEPGRAPGKGATKEARQQYNQQLTEQMSELSRWWLRRMAAVEQPVHEKLTLWWHNHFATSAQKVRIAAYMGAQNQTLRELKLGDFRTLAHAMLTDATQQRLLQTFDDALTPFLNEIAADRYGKNVVVLAYSEFGRRVAANASQGTDHGTTGPVFVAGAPVKGGFYGDEPSLTDLDNGDLKATTDFRGIYAELLSRTIGTDPTPSVGPGRSDLGFL
jgi:uncharacterized protein (DUF1501 family)